MTYVPSLINYTTLPKDSLRSGAIKINANFDAMAIEANSHIADTSIHKELDDNTTSGENLWSAQKIQSLLDAAMFGVSEFSNSVLDKDISAPPSSPTYGDRYIIATGATGDWLGNDLAIAEYDSDAWVFTPPTSGLCTYVDDEGLLYVFNGTYWVAINNYSLSSTEPPSVSSSTSGTTGNSSDIARGNHSHDLGEHAHSGSTSGGVISHTALTSVGTNTHSTIDTFISSRASASGLATLDTNLLVVQNPSNATTTRTASKIPVADASGRLNSWLEYGDGPGEVCEGDDPRLLTTNQKEGLAGTVGEPSADNPYVTHRDLETLAIEIKGDLLELNYSPVAFTPGLTPEVLTATQLSAYMKGIDAALQAIKSRLDYLEAV